MKITFIFIGLKIAEILAVAIIFTIFSYITKLIYDFENYWLNGVMGILITIAIIGLIGLFIVGGIEFFKLNWDWANKLGGGK